MSPIPSNEPDRLAGFLGDVDALIGDPSYHGQIAVVVIDVATPNQYEELRRTLGQAGADLFADAFAALLRTRLPAHTKLYDLSGVRFGCVLQVESPGRVKEILDRLAYGIRRPQPAGRAVPLATSVGIGVAWHSDHGANAVELLAAAVSGAHESLEGDKAWCSFSPSFDRVSRRAVHLLRDIGPALADPGQLRLVYQPKVELSTGRCIGAEALVRWNHPTLGTISPGEFVPLVEGTTLVHALTDWALATALPQVARWRAAGFAPQISINVSMRDLGDDGFAARLAELLERHGVRPDWIDIEVTESAVMKDPRRVGRQLAEIQRLGVAIEIDDYGTGQSGLSYLKHIPATYVKIDAAHVSRLTSDQDDQIMVRSTIDLVHALGRRVVAEGIEDEAALDWLRAQGCDIGQGYAISRPLEVDGFEHWLRKP